MSSENSFDPVGLAHLQRRQRRTPWVVSFGDLLTLLLCFFLTMVSFGPLGSGHKEQANKGLEPMDPAFPAPGRRSAAAAAPGIVLAKSLNVAPRTESVRQFANRSFIFAETDFDVEPELPDSRKREVMFEEIKTLSAKVVQVDVETCGGKADESGDAAWEIAGKRSLALGREIANFGVNPAQVRLRVLGQHCELLMDPELLGRPAAVRISWKIENPFYG